VITLIKVVLPLPLGPMSSVTLPRGTVRSTPSKALRLPKCFETPLTSSIGSRGPINANHPLRGGLERGKT